MKSHLMRGLAVAILAIPLLIASCSKKDKSTGTNPGAAPTLTAPQFSQTVNIVGSDASSAKTKVQDQIAMVGPLLATPAAFATAANSGQWGAKVDSCWSQTSTQGSCTTTVEVCDVGSGSYEWTRTLDGTCGGTARAGWVGVDATVTGDGSGGIFSLFKDNTTDLDTLWKWTTASDKNSKEWNVYKGAESEANRIAKLQWSKGTGSSANNWTFVKAGTTTALAAEAGSSNPVKWELHVSTDAKSGSADIYDWSAAASPTAYWPRHHIAWSDTTGTWIEYDVNHNVTHETTWPTTTTLPQIHIPTIGQDVVINSTDECAQVAKAMVDGQIIMARAFTSIGTSFLGFFNSTEWGTPINGCWTYSVTAGGCTWEYKLCQVSGGFNLTWTYDGNCGGTVYDHFVILEGTTNTDGTSGSLVVYDDNPTTVAMTWTWTSTSDGKSGTWTSYSGVEAEANLESQITWSENTDGSTDVTFEMFGSGRMKWVTHESADGTSGSLKTYEWDDTSSAYWMQSEIIWNSDGSGSQTTYDQDGTVIDECHWT